MDDKELDRLVKDRLEAEGWRREGNYIGHKISERYERAYERTKKETVKMSKQT